MIPSFVLRLIASLGAVAITAASASAQTSFQGLTPGASTRDDVERALGTPLSGTGEVAEYRAPQGMQKVTVRYRLGPVSNRPPSAEPIAETIEVFLVQPVTRRALAARFNVTGDGNRSTSADGRLIEFFGAPALLAFTYATADPASGVTSISHFSAGSLGTASTMAAAPQQRAPADLDRARPRADDQPVAVTRDTTRGGAPETISAPESRVELVEPASAYRGGSLTLDVFPASVTRGSTHRVLVAARGDAAAAFRTLSVGTDDVPADGVRIVSVQDAPPQADRRLAATVVIAVAADAAPGERPLTITLPGGGTQVAAPQVRDPALAKEIQRLMAELTRNDDERVEVGTIRVNTHQLEITEGVLVPSGRDDQTLVVTVSDAAGDVSATVRGERGQTEIRAAAKCPDSAFMSMEPVERVERRDATRTVLTATLSRLSVQSGCELRVRVRDDAGNLSDWFAIKPGR